MSDIDRLFWEKELGFGYFPVRENPYDKSYFEKYLGYAETPMGVAITRARVDLVRRYAGDEPVVDIGIGCGQFIETRGSAITTGYDVNPEAIRWLLDRNLWADPYFKEPVNATCFDSLEHMKRPERFVELVERRLFLSIPIFEDRAHVSRSKHFRPDEHFFYFTRDGLVKWMERLDFILEEENRMETDLGREGIGTFVFKRKTQRIR